MYIKQAPTTKALTQVELVIDGVGEEEDGTDGLEDRGHGRVIAVKVASLVAGGAGGRGGAAGETLVEVDDLGHLLVVI